MRTQWTIVLTSNSGNPVQASNELKQLLKIAGRAFKMTCAEISSERLVAAPIRRIPRTDSRSLFDRRS